MVRSPSRGWRLALVSCALTASGCISLSLGGKHDHLDVGGAITRAATDPRFETIESRIASLEEGARRCGCTGPDPVVTETASATVPASADSESPPAMRPPTREKSPSR